MQRSRLCVSILLGGVLCGCPGGTGGTGSATQGTSTSTGEGTSVTGGPTEGTGSSTGSTGTGTTTTTSTSDSGASETCASSHCEDMPKGQPACDNWAQDCPEGQKCGAYVEGEGGTWNALKCVEVTGQDLPGEPCEAEDRHSGQDSCVAGAMCWDLDKRGVGICIALCTGSAEAPVCEGFGTCIISNEGVLNLCEPLCDPVAQDCLDEYEACHALADGTHCGQYGIEEKALAGEPCESFLECDKGLSCMDAAVVGKGCMDGASGCCTPYCSFPGGACANADQQCIQFYDPMQYPAEHPLLEVGVCGVAG